MVEENKLAMFWSMALLVTGACCLWRSVTFVREERRRGAVEGGACPLGGAVSLQEDAPDGLGRGVRDHRDVTVQWDRVFSLLYQRLMERTNICCHLLVFFFKIAD